MSTRRSFRRRCCRLRIAEPTPARGANDHRGACRCSSRRLIVTSANWPGPDLDLREWRAEDPGDHGDIRYRRSLPHHQHQIVAPWRHAAPRRVAAGDERGEPFQVLRQIAPRATLLQPDAASRLPQDIFHAAAPWVTAGAELTSLTPLRVVEHVPRRAQQLLVTNDDDRSGSRHLHLDPLLGHGKPIVAREGAHRRLPGDADHEPVAVFGGDEARQPFVIRDHDRQRPSQRHLLGSIGGHHPWHEGTAHSVATAIGGEWIAHRVERLTLQQDALHPGTDNRVAMFVDHGDPLLDQLGEPYLDRLVRGADLT